MKYNYKKTFDLMVAYHGLGDIENKIIKHLMTTDVFEGTSVDLGKRINVDQNNTRNGLYYLEALGLVKIKRLKYIEEVEKIIRKDGKKTSTVNPMKSCCLVEDWMEVLIKQYKDGNIYKTYSKKRDFINHMKAL